MHESPIKNLVSTIPQLPGCYIFYDENHTPIYVGKAKNLKKRVSSYFTNYSKLVERIQLMIDNARDIETFVVDSEYEALLLEATLIKKYKPKYNVLLKDDKSYSWIKITKSEYPIVTRARNTKDKNAYYFGPFQTAEARDGILKFVRREFPYRSCSYDLNEEELKIREERRRKGEKLINKLCTFYHIGRCPGPCENLISKEEYHDNIDKIIKFLRNKKTVLLKDLENKMKYYADNLEFEKAAQIKIQIDEIKKLNTNQMIGLGDEEDDVLYLEYQRAIKGLKIIVNRLGMFNFKNKSKEEIANYLDNFRIECFDISNIQGTNPVGSMVVNIGGKMVKSHYRKFKIHSKNTPDDFSMMQEVLERRLLYLVSNINENVNILEEVKNKIKKNDSSFSTRPDLIIIDGGKGQLNAVLKVLKSLDISDINIISLAKKREEVYIPKKPNPISFHDKKEALFLLQRIRDEAHRFGITFHRDRRSNSMLQ
ncbi:MAG: excinuclease ABC subunit UvrC [Candidatus Dojkabacteria bacterium]|nr:excinuclease ABC subunit UvrC [Candidatus Dojkabacteria bacterium]